MDQEQKKVLSKIANTIRGLSMDAVQKANSGHPGLPMGCAEFGAYLYGSFLQHNPKNPRWINRDRFILSAGHGSMLLYSCLYLSGFDLTLDDIKQFRQLHSKTPGHPERHVFEGVEATTGPLGQGVGNAVGQALGFKLLAKKFNSREFSLFTPKIICLAGDGCMMEGISSEASSLAGHLQLDNLILVHDANEISLDGPLQESCSENMKARYLAYGFDVYDLDGYDFDAMDKLFTHLRENQQKPAFIQMKTIIGKGSPHKAGSSKAHGSPLGVEEVIESKRALGIPEEDFYVPQQALNFMQAKLPKCAELERRWNELFSKWKLSHPDQEKIFEKMRHKELPENLEEILRKIPMKSPLAGRSASQQLLNAIADELPFLYGGSADLSCSDLTMMKNLEVVTPGHFTGRNIKYGVREFAMAAMATGLAETSMIIPFIGTFLTFSDYMRNAIRLAALSHVHVIYQFTHDSVLLGEDGPTHQPVEHYASLRAMPDLHFIRPGDNNEVKMAWLAALRYKGPTAIALSRQALPDLPGTAVPYDEGMGRGAYIIKKESGTPQYTLCATGSELSLALDVATSLEKIGKPTRVVSMPCWELFEKETSSYQAEILGGNIGKRVSIEAGVSLGWHRWIGSDGITISIETFGASAPQSDLAQEFGLTVDAILERLLG